MKSPEVESDESHWAHRRLRSCCNNRLGIVAKLVIFSSLKHDLHVVPFIREMPVLQSAELVKATKRAVDYHGTEP